jgi:transcription antitermination factor NusG
VKSRCEKVVAAAARSKGFEDFLPLHTSRRRWSDRLMRIDEPLFPGYVFCRLNVEDRFALLTIPRVMYVVGAGNIPTVVADKEIVAIRDALRAEAVVRPWPFVEAGQRARLTAGPLIGLEGLLMQADHQQQMVLSLTALKQSIAVEIEHEWIGSLDRAGQPALNSQF